MDGFVEKIVARRKTTTDYLVIAGLIIGGIILVILSGLIPIGGISLLVFAGICYLVYYFATSRNIEFEYIVTNSDVDVDKIISKRKRKRIFSANCKEFDIVAKYKSTYYTPEVKNIQNKIDATSTIESPDVYFATLNYKGERTVLFFEPNEKMLDMFKSYIPRKVFK